MKTIGQTYPLSEFEPGDVGAFVFLDGTDGEPFILDYHRGSRSYIQYAHNVSSLQGSETTPARYLGRGRIEPARIVMEGESDPTIEQTVRRVLAAAMEPLFPTEDRHAD